jgi:hypothetical protein
MEPKKVATPFPDRIALALGAILAMYALVETFTRHSLGSVLWIWAVVAGVFLSLAFRRQRAEFSRKVTEVKPEKYRLF